MANWAQRMELIKLEIELYVECRPLVRSVLAWQCPDPFNLGWLCVGEKLCCIVPLLAIIIIIQCSSSTFLKTDSIAQVKWSNKKILHSTDFLCVCLCSKLLLQVDRSVARLCILSSGWMWMFCFAMARRLCVCNGNSIMSTHLLNGSINCYTLSWRQKRGVYRKHKWSIHSISLHWGLQQTSQTMQNNFIFLHVCLHFHSLPSWLVELNFIFWSILQNVCVLMCTQNGGRETGKMGANLLHNEWMNGWMDGCVQFNIDCPTRLFAEWWIVIFNLL